MNIGKMKVLIEAGAVRSVEVLPEPGGWVVWIVYGNGEQREALERQRGGVRMFTTLDAVASTLVASGIKSFRVTLK